MTFILILLVIVIPLKVILMICIVGISTYNVYTIQYGDQRYCNMPIVI